MHNQETQTESNESCTRRDFNRLAIAAFGGMIAGIGQQQAQAEDKPVVAKRPNQDAAPATETKPAPKKVVKREIHICRGLNGCKGHGLPMDFDGNGTLDLNECAGQGYCATAKYITCTGHNDCKRQGGCGEMPGENECRGRGRCAVPLRDDTWKIARVLFETRMKKFKVKFGTPPPKDKTPQGGKYK